jgi:hypothetical protein
VTEPCILEPLFGMALGAGRARTLPADPLAGISGLGSYMAMASSVARILLDNFIASHNYHV